MSWQDNDLRPVAQSREAFDLLAGAGEPSLEECMRTMSGRVHAIVPDLVAMSLSLLADDLTFTLVADREDAGLLDAMQYLETGPCVTAVHERLPMQAEPTDEDRWRWFAQAQAARGIGSTLSLPLPEQGALVGCLNLYGSTPRAFDGRHEEIARACGALAQGAVTNADLSFTTRMRAVAAPVRLRDRATVDLAVGYVAAYKHIDVDAAGAQIRDAASRAGVSEVDVARLVLDVHAEQAR